MEGSLTDLVLAIAHGDRDVAVDLLRATPSLATAGLARRDEQFIAARIAQSSIAVEALLRAGADPRRTTDGGSTAADLARLTTGRGGTGTPEAKAEQQVIIELLRSA